MNRGVPGSAGIQWIVYASILVGLLMTLADGSLAHWVGIIGGIVVGLWAVQAINCR